MFTTNPDDGYSVILDEVTFEIWVAQSLPSTQYSDLISFDQGNDAQHSRSQRSPNPNYLAAHQREIFVLKNKRNAFINQSIRRSKHFATGQRWIIECQKQYSLFDLLDKCQDIATWTIALAQRPYADYQDSRRRSEMKDVMLEETIQCFCKVFFNQIILASHHAKENSRNLEARVMEELIHFTVKDIFLEFSLGDWIKRRWPGGLGWMCNIVLRELGADVCVWLRYAVRERVWNLTGGGNEFIVVIVVQCLLHSFAEWVLEKARDGREGSHLAVLNGVVLPRLLGAGLEHVFTLCVGAFR